MGLQHLELCVINGIGFFDKLDIHDVYNSVDHSFTHWWNNSVSASKIGFAYY